MTAVAAQTCAGEGRDATGSTPEATEREPGAGLEQGGGTSLEEARPARGSPEVAGEVGPGEVAGDAAGRVHTGGAVEGTALVPEQQVGDVAGQVGAPEERLAQTAALVVPQQPVGEAGGPVVELRRPVGEVAGHVAAPKRQAGDVAGQLVVPTQPAGEVAGRVAVPEQQPGDVAGQLAVLEQAGQTAEPVVIPEQQAGEAAEQLAAAVTAALRPDAAPLDYAPCRQGVGAAVQRLRGALLGLINELEPRTGTTAADSATTRAHHLAADIRFVRPHELG